LYAVWKKIGDPNVVLCLGDSITEGYRCIGLPYPSRLASMSGKSVRNYGKGGKLASYGAGIAEQALQKENPGIVCILFGANDAIHHVSPSETKENLRKIIRLCRKYNAQPIIATPTPQIGSHERFNSGVKAIASQVRSLAREENVTLVDLNSAFGSGKSYLNPADGLHLSDAGGNLMAREVYKAF
jgi:lysophospholipase L1-like esterase